MVRQKLCKGVVKVGKECGVLATGQLVDGYTRVAQKFDKMAKRVGKTGVKVQCSRKRHSGEGGQRVYQEYTFLKDRLRGDDAADALRYLVATKSRAVTQRKLRGM